MAKLNAIVAELTQLQSAQAEGREPAAAAAAAAVASANPEQRFAAFQAWATAGGFAAIKDVAVKTMGAEGNGLVASAPIAGGELMFEVPLKLMMSVEKASTDADSTLKEFFRFSALTNTDKLALYLLSEQCLGDSFFKVRARRAVAWDDLVARLLRRQATDPSPPPLPLPQPYIDILPDTFSIPLFYTVEQLASLQGSPVLAQVVTTAHHHPARNPARRTHFPPPPPPPPAGCRGLPRR
jgi:hypothetical protein